MKRHALLLPALVAVIATLALLALPTAHAQDWKYHMQPGDTLWDLCNKYTSKKGCWRQLKLYNGVQHDRLMPVGSVVRIPLRWLNEPPVIGRVLSTAGEVSYTKRSGTEPGEIGAGSPLHLGARLATGEGSASLLLSDDRRVLVRPHTSLLFRESPDDRSGAGATVLDLERGSVEASVESGRERTFKVGTPSAVAAVRGTRFRVAAAGDDDPVTRCEVEDGNVELATSDKLVLGAGQGAVADTSGRPLEAVDLAEPPTFTLEHLNRPGPVEVTWSSDETIKAWEIDLFAADGEEILGHAQLVHEPRFARDDLADGCYVLAVRAVDALELRGREGRTTICLVPQLGAVRGLALQRDGYWHPSWNLSWAPLEGAVAYRVAVLAPDAPEPLAAFQVDEPGASLPELERGPFEVRVQAVDRHGNVGVPGTLDQESVPDTVWVPFGMAAILILLI